MSTKTPTLRDQFPGYFRPTKDEFDELWTNALIVPDTNILLHLLRYGEATRKEVFAALHSLQPRIWVPYRVAFEFLRRWRSVDQSNRLAYEQLPSKIESAGNALSALFDQVARHQTIDAEKEKQKVKKFVAGLLASLEKAKQSHPSEEDAEAIRDEIVSLIGDQFGVAPTSERRLELVKEGKRRFEARIPPGFMDEKKDRSEDDKYGDYFIWEEMIAIAKARGMPLIFVSDDRKEDWIARERGRDVGPLPELVQEFAQRTGQKFYCYPFRAFLEQSKHFAGVAVSAKAIAEIVEEEAQSRKEDAAEQEARRNRALGIAATGGLTGAPTVGSPLLVDSSWSSGTPFSSNVVSSMGHNANLTGLASSLTGAAGSKSLDEFSNSITTIQNTLTAANAINSLGGIANLTGLANSLTGAAGFKSLDEFSNSITTIQNTLTAANAINSLGGIANLTGLANSLTGATAFKSLDELSNSLASTRETLTVTNSLLALERRPFGAAEPDEEGD